MLSNMDVIIMLSITSILFWFGHGCSGKRMLSITWMKSWFRHGCSGKCMLSNMDVIRVWACCSGKRMLSNMDVIMVGAWMLW